MKKSIHPPMFKDAKTTCSTCGTVYEIPSTVQTQSIEICRSCHPIYTGKAQKDLKGGRVDRFRQRMAKGKSLEKK